MAQLREEHGLSRRKLAERIGSTLPAIARREGGGITPILGTIERIAVALDAALVIEFRARMSRPANRATRGVKVSA